MKDYPDKSGYKIQTYQIISSLLDGNVFWAWQRQSG